MIDRHKVNAKVCYVLNNSLDPFINIPDNFTKPDHLLKKFKLKPATPVIFTLTRITSNELFKGYDNVIIAISRLKEKFPEIKYILSGQYSAEEETRITNLVNDVGVNNQIILTGFIPEDELNEYFLLADLFVLPSKKEGFGLVFIEALARGLRIICGNADGSMDAIKDGELGKAINPDDIDELENSIDELLTDSITPAERKKLQQKCLQYFSEEMYVQNIQKLLATAD
nr:glycosyltransferase family 4 protein [Mucilaginibacter segetis]